MYDLWFAIRFILLFIFFSSFNALVTSADVKSESSCNELNCNEAKRTWDHAQVYIPSSPFIKKISMFELHKQMKAYKGDPLPVAIYLHGCSGFWAGSDIRGFFLAELGLVVIAPNSFAREYKPVSCIPNQFRGGLHRGTLALRQEEASYAISQASDLPWVDKDNILLIGFSEGGITTAKLTKPKKVKLKSRIIEGWGCHSPWHEYAGLNSAGEEPVLSLVADRDPWFAIPSLRGACGKFMKNKMSKSLVYSKGALSYSHSLLDKEAPQKALESFICKYLICGRKIPID